MKKRNYLWFLLLIIPVIIFVVFACLFCKDGNNAKWLELSLSTSGTIATIILGVMVYIQAEKHKANADEDRKQDLLLRANPHAVFNKIECVRYSAASMLLSKENTYNRLTNIDYEGIHTFNEHVYMDLNFSVPAGNILERIYIKRVRLNAYKGEFGSADLEEIAEYSLKNYSFENNSTNIKVNGAGDVDSLLSLLFDLVGEDYFDQNDIKNLLDDREIKWAMNIYYTLSNSFGVRIDYRTHIKFALEEGVKDSYGDIEYALIKPEIVTIQTSNIAQGENK